MARNDPPALLHPILDPPFRPCRLAADRPSDPVAVVIVGRRRARDHDLRGLGDIAAGREGQNAFLADGRVHGGSAAQAARRDDGTVFLEARAVLEAERLERVGRLLTHVGALLLRRRVRGVERLFHEKSE